MSPLASNPKFFPKQNEHWARYLLATIVLVTILPLLPHPYADPQILVGSVGGLWAFAFYMQTQHAENARFLKELLEKFNQRYDEMNDVLQSAIRSKNGFTESERDLFIDYFNLCSEEWLFWQAGYVYDPVWHSWENGMRQYGKDPRVQELWATERQTNSYYRFEFPRLGDASKGNPRCR
jgi:hypothetical protein